ncbi:MAG: hypothetical protein IJK23_00160 [Clostridia bacterium]|nr:hypothetical protein [Clostridia bacterium]
MQRSFIRRPVSILLSLLMALSVFGALSFTAGASGEPSFSGFSTLPTSDDGLSVGDYWFDLASFLADAAAQGMPAEAAAQYTDGTYFYFLSDDHDTFRLATRQDYNDYVRGTEMGDYMFPYISQYSPAGQGYAVGDLIEFGGYPQSQVTDADTVAALDALDKTWVSYGYYSGTGSQYDGNMIPGDWMRYADVMYDGARYRAVTFDAYRPIFTGYSSDASKTYQDENGYAPGNTYYFKFESLQWRVLDPAAGRVLCESIIDAQAYQNVVYDNGSAYYQGIGSLVFASDYATSSIRSWLNDDFYNTAFSEAEKALIAETVLDNKAYKPEYSQYDGASTTDKIFLLSYGELQNTAYGFNSDPRVRDAARSAQGTDYAKCQGIYVNPLDSNSYWRLRSPGYDSGGAAVVGNDGGSYVGYVDGADGGVRPAFQFESGITESVNPNGALQVGDLIEFGGYPQTQVTDADTVAALDALEKTWISYGYYSGTGGMYDGNMVPGDWMRYADVPYDGARYRAVTFDSYRPMSTGYGSSVSASYQDDNGYGPGNTYYFKFEPLQWRVLDPAAGLVLCESVIDSQAYQNVIYKNGSECYQGIGSDVYANDYATSSIRDWLNDDFYNTAFIEAEKALIAETPLDNSAHLTEYSQYDSASTTDKIFLLSYGEALNPAYGFSADTGRDAARSAQGTDYAKCQGIHVLPLNQNSCWRLRSPGSSSASAANIDYDGRCYVAYVDGVGGGVRPAFQFKSGITESVNPDGYECTDHKAGAPVESVLTAAGCGSAGEKKLTYYCTVCGEFINETTGPIPATGEHVWKWVVDDEPTCGTAGKKHQECENCDAVQAENTAIDPTGEHVWKWVVDDEPTCGAAGRKHQECENCDAVQAENTAIDPTGEHVWKWVVDDEPTCGVAGKQHQECENCDAVQAENTVIDPTGEHVWTWVVDDEPTCGAAGKKHQECENCDAVQAENTAIEATGEHVWKWVVDKAATCGKAGVKHQECENCGATQNENTEIEATGEHVWTWVVDKAATCGKAGVKHQECENCDATQNENTEIEATGEHVWKWVVDKAATCGKAGVKHQECENCDAVQAENTAIPATGDHVTKRQGAKEATETEDGYTGDLVCTVCGKLIKKGTVIPATGTDTPEEPDEPTVGGKIHGEHCFCYDYKGDGLMVNLVRYLCAIFCFFWNIRGALGV